MAMVFRGSSPPPDADVVQDILLKLRRKEGTWVDWAQGCQTLQKAGLNPQQIFEETGFEPIQQNQIVVAEQVYQSAVKWGWPTRPRPTSLAGQRFALRTADSLPERSRQYG
jgi:hypothetical protein